MKRGKQHRRPPKTGNYGGWIEGTVKPIENEPDPSKMIDVWCGGSHHIIVDVPDERVPPLLPECESWPSAPPATETAPPQE
jgi:hypothetical protein